MVTKVMSPKYSMKNWVFSVWLKGNWKSIKEVIKVGLPLVVAWAQTNNPAMIGLITILGKFILDIGEYYLKEQK